MTVQEKLYTIAQFWEIAHQPENEHKRLELVNGVIIEVPPSSTKNGILASRLAHLISNFIEGKGLGYVSGPDTGYELGPNTVRQPDAAYISKVRAGGLEGKTFPVGPDLAVEVISPSETSRTILDKAYLYLHAGTRAVWVVDPEAKKVDVYRMVDQDKDELGIQTFGLDDTLDAGDALPGFKLALHELFSVLKD